MNRRLFWKILIIFWGIFYLTFQLTWIGFSFYIQNRYAKTYYHIPTKVEMIAQLLQISGEREAVNFISHLPEPERLCFSITLSNAQDEHIKVVSNDLKDGSFIYQKTAIAPDGIIYLITFKDSNKNYSNGSIFNLPIPMFLMGISGGLLFSLFLAWNLTRPMKLLRQGFFRVSQGDLSVRLYEHLKLRHDELSELAKDFDSMVEQLDILITDRQVLLHDVSHELRTPLARLQLAIGLAQQNKQNIDNSLARIELESQRLDALIGEILNYSRAEMNNSLDEYFDLKALISVIVDDAKYEAEPQHIIINFTCEPIIHSIIKGNSEQIRRAIENIIRNAIRFSQKEQQIDIHLKEVGKYLQVVVSDHGPGVDVHKLSSIFEPFVRIQSPQLGKGYGLGLAIARKSITMHNGSIQAKNRESRGLNMTIKLPYWRG
ncbi:ATP-binding protein [Frischella perrara]|uniref:ATP-binding protein n=1 Tax=Frischella perrara TaxID=1267021 RepID=UPI0023F43786|nr:ATP-binding protein [Frischella perrara]